MTGSAWKYPQVPGSPFRCRVRDGDCGSVGEADYSEGGHVTVELEHLASIAVAQPAEFTIRVPEVRICFHFSGIFCLDLFSTFTQGADAELAVSVQGPVEDIPVKVNI